MDDELNLDELAALADDLTIDGANVPWMLCRRDYSQLTLDELMLIKNTLPRLIELARIGQSVKDGRITVDGYVKPNPIIIELDDE